MSRASKYNVLGFDPQKAADDGRGLSRIFRNLQDTVAKLTDAVGSKLFADLKGPISDLNTFLLANGDKIAGIVSKIAAAFVEMLKFLAENLPKLDNFVASMGGWNNALKALGLIVTATYVANFVRLFGALSGLASLAMPPWALAILGVGAAGALYI